MGVALEAEWLEERRVRESRLLSMVTRPMAGLAIIVTLAFLLTDWAGAPVLSAVMTGATTLLFIAAELLNRRGWVRTGSWLFLGVLLVGIWISAFIFSGLGGPTPAMFPVVVLFAGLLRGAPAAIAMAVACSLAIAALALIEHLGGLPAPMSPNTPGSQMMLLTAAIAATTVFLVVALRVMNQALDAAIAHAETARRTEHQLAESRRMESVGRLAGGVAHDFNNLLTAIMANSEELSEDFDLEPEAQQLAAQTLETAQRAAGLTAQLLAFARKQVMDPRVLDLNGVVGSLRPLLARLVPENVDLNLQCAPAALPVRADPAQLEQVIINLVANGRDAMPRGGKLTIETAAIELDAAYGETHPGVTPGPHVMFAVTDTGEGMAPETLDRVFEPFFTTREDRGGTGLGLAMVHGIVRQSQGQIFVYSEPGRGTSFKVYLPRVEAGDETALTEAAAPEANAEPGPAPEEITILVVDDEAVVRQSAARALESEGYHVLRAGNGGEALELVQGQPRVDLLITDVVMPDVGGPELAAQLEDRFPDVRVLYVSGYSENAIHHHGELAPGTNFMPKPFTPTALRRRVRAILGKGGA